MTTDEHLKRCRTGRKGLCYGRMSKQDAPFFNREIGRQYGIVSELFRQWLAAMSELQQYRPGSIWNMWW